MRPQHQPPAVIDPRNIRRPRQSAAAYWLKVILVVLSVPALLGLGCFGLFAVIPAARHPAQPRAPVAAQGRVGAKTLTMAHYNAIQTGMSHDQVEQIVGWDGRELSRSRGFNGGETYTVVWSSGLASMTIIFDRGQVASKAQVGLR